MDALHVFLSVCLGIGLSAACGFRVFVPLLCLSIAAVAGDLHLTPGFAWIGTWPALIAFAVATAVEIAGYYIPWVDNALDTVAGPAAIIAGTIATASVVTDIPPFWRWTLALIAGGGAAASTQLVTTKLRLASSATTSGIANPVLSTAELGASTVLSVLAVLWPLAAFVLALLILIVCWLLIRLVGKQVIQLFRKKEAVV